MGYTVSLQNNHLPIPLPVLGVGVTPFTDYQDAISSIKRLIESNQKAFSVAVNPEKIYCAQQNRQIMDILNKAQIHICDGIGAALAVRLLHGKGIARITGISLFLNLMQASVDNNWKIFLLGASPEINQKAQQKLLEDYPNLKIAGRQDGYFQNTNEVIRNINESKADLLFVAMGSPKQELWIIDNRDQINASFCMGVGGTFDVVSGEVKWAPAFFRVTGTEWLFRLVSDPKRLKRQWVLPVFALQVLWTKLSTLFNLTEKSKLK